MLGLNLLRSRLRGRRRHLSGGGLRERLRRLLALRLLTRRRVVVHLRLPPLRLGALGEVASWVACGLTLHRLSHRLSHWLSLHLLTLHRLPHWLTLHRLSHRLPLEPLEPRCRVILHPGRPDPLDRLQTPVLLPRNVEDEYEREHRGLRAEYDGEDVDVRPAQRKLPGGRRERDVQAYDDDLVEGADEEEEGGGDVDDARLVGC